MPVRAADLDTGSLKDPLPDTLSWYGVTVYGNIDVGYAYQSHGVPSGGSFPQVLEYNIWNAKNANRTISTVAADALARTNIGIDDRRRHRRRLASRRQSGDRLTTRFRVSLPMARRRS